MQTKKVVDPIGEIKMDKVTMESVVDDESVSSYEKRYGLIEFKGRKYILIRDAEPVENANLWSAEAINLGGDIDARYIVEWAVRQEYLESEKLFKLDQELQQLQAQRFLDDGEIMHIEELENSIKNMEDNGICNNYCEDGSNACDWDNPDKIEEI